MHVDCLQVNWCQSWFEYVPYPPVNVLETVKRLLVVHDSQLITHYNDCHVTPDIYIWSLLETAFYEVRSLVALVRSMRR